MTATTHVLGTGYRCLRCGEQIPKNTNQKGWQIGDSVGVLLSQHANPVSYATGSKDTNEPCSPSASAVMSPMPSINYDIHLTTNASDAD